MVAVKNNKDIGEKINIIIRKFGKENDLADVFGEVDFEDEPKLGSGKEMQERLTELVGIFEGLDLHANRVEGDDLLGDAYEYLMRNFATESGKSKGQFYTPAEVSRIIANIIGIGPEYHPKPHHLRPDLRFWFITAQGCRQSTKRYQCLRTGKGQCHPCTGADEHGFA